MFENAFNLKFNLHKAYVDIGIGDDNLVRLAQSYDIPQQDIGGILEGFLAENKKNAASILADFPDIQMNTENKVKITYIGDSITSDRISHQRIMECILEPYK